MRLTLLACTLLVGLVDADAQGDGGGGEAADTNWWEANTWSDAGGQDYTRANGPHAGADPWSIEGSGHASDATRSLWEGSGDGGAHFGTARIDDEDTPPIGDVLMEGSADGRPSQWPPPLVNNRHPLTPEVNRADATKVDNNDNTNVWWQEHTSSAPPALFTSPAATITTTTSSSQSPATTPYQWDSWTSTSTVRPTSTIAHTTVAWSPIPSPTGSNDDDSIYETTPSRRGGARDLLELLLRPGILAAVVGGCVVGLLLAIMLVFFVVYRMRKKDEGSYALDEPNKSNNASASYAGYAYQKAPTGTKEFYA